MFSGVGATHQQFVPLSTIPESANWLHRGVKWLRAEDINALIVVIFRRVIAALISIVLVGSLVGIPLLIAGAVEWVRQQKRQTILPVNSPTVPVNPNPFPSGPPKQAPSEPINSKQAPAAPTNAKQATKIRNCHEMLWTHNEMRHGKENLIPPLLRPEPEAFGSTPMDVPWKTIPALSMIADYLCEKNGLNDFFVCNSMDAFKRKLEEINTTKEARLVLIVPSYQSSCTCIHKKGCRDAQHKSPDYHNQHKVPVFIEKKGDSFKIAVVDSGNDRGLQMHQTYLDDENNFGCSEILHAYMREAKLNNATYYYTKVRRHWAQRGGCSTFALRDAVIFLRNRQFFEEIDAKGGIDRTEERGSINNPYYVTNLPPEFMKTMQSLSRLDAYKNSNSPNKKLFDLTAKIGKHNLTLEQCVKKHTDTDSNQNKLIDKRIAKYHKLILGYLSTLSPEEMVAKINKRLLV